MPGPVLQNAVVMHRDTRPPAHLEAGQDRWNGQDPETLAVPRHPQPVLVGRPIPEQRMAKGDQARDDLRAPAPALQTALEKMS